MKEISLKSTLLNKGLFTRVDKESLCADSETREFVYFWRKVIDEMLLGLVNANTSAKEHSLRWFNSEPGDEDFYIDEETGEEILVDAHYEYVLTCTLAGVDPVTVTDIANRLYMEVNSEK